MPTPDISDAPPRSGGGQAGRAIDKAYYTLRLPIYYRDLLIAQAAFVAAFVWALNASGWAFAIAFAAAVIALHRAGFFIHEITHQSGNRRLRAFTLYWDLTVGTVTTVPSARFIRPHLTHHTVGIFRTKGDPQYLLLRNDWKLAVLILVVVPPIMPIFNVVLTVISSIGGIAAEEAIENFLLRRGMPTGSALPAKHKRRVTQLSRFYVVAWAPYVYLFPETLPLMYAVLTAVWYLSTWRIPVEHRMESRLDSSDKHDQFADSFTLESPISAILQPIGLKYHTAHHMYAGVPYHNLPALHAELKATDPAYRRNCVSLWQAIRGYPSDMRPAETGAD